MVTVEALFLTATSVIDEQGEERQEEITHFLFVDGEFYLSTNSFVGPNSPNTPSEDEEDPEPIPVGIPENLLGRVITWEEARPYLNHSVTHWYDWERRMYAWTNRHIIVSFGGDCNGVEAIPRSPTADIPQLYQASNNAQSKIIYRGDKRFSE